MNWNPKSAGALRAKWRYRPDWWTALSRRGVCLRRCLAHVTHPEKASRRAAAHRFAGA